MWICIQVWLPKPHVDPWTHVEVRGKDLGAGSPCDELSLSHLVACPLTTEPCKPLLYVHTQIFLVIISPLFYFPFQNMFALPTYYYLFLKS